MHIADGVLPGAVLAKGAAAGLLGTVFGLSRLKVEEIPRAVGLTPPTDTAGALMLQTMCMAGAGSACDHAGAVGDCVAMKCGDVCVVPPVCPM